MENTIEITDIKKRIIEESLKLFVKYGAKSVTMNDISAKCGISKRTLYENFADKDLLLSVCVKTMNKQSRLEGQAIKQKSDDILSYLVNTIEQLGDESKHINPNFFRELNKFYPKIAAELAEFNEKTTIPDIIEILETGIKEGVIRQDTHTSLATYLLMGQLGYVIESDISEKMKLPASQVLKTIILQFARGIATEKGFERLEKLTIKG